jgi:hypothetical protein
MSTGAAEEADQRPVIEWKIPRKKEHKWAAWAGEKDDLKRIGDCVAKYAQQHLKMDVDGSINISDYELGVIRTKWQTDLIAPHKPVDNMQGPPIKVVEKLDPKTVKWVRFKSGSEPYGEDSAISVKMTPKDGVDLTIESSNFGWLAEAEESLKNEIKRCVPWWSFMRNYWAGAVYILLAGLVGGLIGSAHSGSTTALWVGEVVGWAVALISRFALRRFLPGFEVVPPGGQGKGRHVLGVFGALLFNVIVAVGGIIYTASQASPKK